MIMNAVLLLFAQKVIFKVLTSALDLTFKMSKRLRLMVGCARVVLLIRKMSVLKQRVLSTTAKI